MNYGEPSQPKLEMELSYCLLYIYFYNAPEDDASKHSTLMDPFY